VSVVRKFREMALNFAARQVARRDIVWPSSARPVVTFSFDDFPTSALDAAEILESVGCRGTFFVCGGTLGRPSPVGPLVDLEQVRALSRRGHEIGCHTLSHARASTCSREVFRSDLIANEVFVRDVSGTAPVSFAFPYGSVTPGAKMVAAARYRACRTSDFGINRGRFDLSALKGVALYNSCRHVAAASKAVRDCAGSGGWVVLFTHDVGDAPSPFGCHQSQLVELLHLALGLGCDVLTLGATVDRLNKNSPLT